MANLLLEFTRNSIWQAFSALTNPDGLEAPKSRLRVCDFITLIFNKQLLHFQWHFFSCIFTVAIGKESRIFDMNIWIALYCSRSFNILQNWALF
jgi:hypothetical protein